MNIDNFDEELGSESSDDTEHIQDADIEQRKKLMKNALIWFCCITYTEPFSDCEFETRRTADIN